MIYSDLANIIKSQVLTTVWSELNPDPFLLTRSVARLSGLPCNIPITAFTPV